VSALEPVEISRSESVSRSAAQTRIVTAALDLFGRYGVSGTSLQMIADTVGVTKAAVYHQYKTKEEIVIAVMEDDLRQLEGALDIAEAEEGPRAREVLLALVIDLAVQRRRIVSALQQDPVIIGLLAKHEPFLHLMDRLFAVLTGGDTSAAARVRGAMISAAIGGAVMHPLVVDLDDETLRSQMLQFTRELFELPE
jgi:AcrR family transcriptional regulator